MNKPTKAELYERVRRAENACKAWQASIVIQSATIGMLLWMIWRTLEPLDDHAAIYLHKEEESEDVGRMWCEDKINDDDTKYIHADLFKAQQAEIERLEARQSTCYTGHLEQRVEELEGALDNIRLISAKHQMKTNQSNIDDDIKRVHLNATTALNTQTKE